MSNDREPPEQMPLFASSTPSSTKSGPNSPRSSELATSSSDPTLSTATASSPKRRRRSLPVLGKRMLGSVASVDGRTVVVMPTVDFEPQPPLPIPIVRATPDPVLAIPRPTTRAECKGAQRPCPWASCRYHLLLEEAEPSETASPPDPNDDMNPDGKRPRSLRLNMPPRQGEQRIGRPSGLEYNDDEATVRVWMDDALERLQSMRWTCALDVVDAHPDGISAAAIGRILGVSEQAIDAELHKPSLRDAMRRPKEERDGDDA
jgi:hypothetical protein